MSRIGKKAIQIPNGVNVTVEGSRVSVSGPKGILTLDLRPEISVEVDADTVNTKVKHETKSSGVYWGLTRSLINNMIEGVTRGYEKKLEIVGVGYRAKLEGNKKLVFSIGYSHPVEVDLPEGIDAELEDNQHITIKGIDKQLVGLIAANIRKIRKPEPYKGKGIKYVGEVIRRKQGKSGKV